ESRGIGVGIAVATAERGGTSREIFGVRLSRAQRLPVEEGSGILSHGDPAVFAEQKGEDVPRRFSPRSAGAGSRAAAEHPARVFAAMAICALEHGRTRV